MNDEEWEFTAASAQRKMAWSLSRMNIYPAISENMSALLVDQVLEAEKRYKAASKGVVHDLP